MRRYIALLRGVNISGKNKVPMAELKLGFESLGFPAVSYTHLDVYKRQAPASPNPSQRFVKKLRRTSAGASCPRYCEIMIPATAPMAAMTTA